MSQTPTSPFERFATRLESLSPLGAEERAAILGLGGMVAQVGAGIDLVPPGRQGAYVHFIVEGVIGIATKLGIQVIAEGIEHVEQAEMLAAMGCLAGQGYLYSRAVDTDAIAALVRRGPMLPQAAPALAQKA